MSRVDKSSANSAGLDCQRIARVHQSAINLSLEQLHSCPALSPKARNTLADLAALLRRESRSELSMMVSRESWKTM